MVNRRVHTTYDGDGVVVRWEPLGHAIADTLVRCDRDGKEIWYPSHMLRPIDSAGPLPDRRSARSAADSKALTQLRAIREQHVRDFRQPWPGMEFSKVLLGRALDAAICEVTERLKLED